MPDARFVDLDGQHPIFHSFFEIDWPFDILPQPYDHVPADLPRRCSKETIRRSRLMAMINFNTDISEYWEFAPTGFDAGVRNERGVQARRELRHVRIDALRAGGLKVRTTTVVVQAFRPAR